MLFFFIVVIIGIFFFYCCRSPPSIFVTVRTMALNGFSTSRWVSQLPPFARRAFQVDQMEFDSALSQMYSLCTKPSLVSKMSKARKMTKNRYQRDDPAFLVLQLLFIVVTTLAYSLALGSGISLFFYRLFVDVLVNYLLAGCILASVEWMIMNKFLFSPGRFDEVRREVDWLYSLDVHFNGYFTYFMWTKVFLFIPLPLIVAEGTNFIPLFVGNTFVAIGCLTYVYNVFLGYLELPMLCQQQKLMYPIPIIVLVYILATFGLNVNVALWFLESNWGY